MRELFLEIPDPDVVCALSREELGFKLLGYLLAKYPNPYDFRSQHISAYNLILDAPMERHGSGNGYPTDRANEIGLAYSEAIAWLLAEGFLVPKPESDSWLVISRKARSEQIPNRMIDRTRLAKFPRELLHCRVQSDAWLSFLRGDYSTSIFQAMREVEISVRDAASLSKSLVGTSLMREAFHKERGNLTDHADIDSEKDAIAALFAGSIGLHKNPHSHSHVELSDPVEVFEILVLSSHLLRLVDRRMAD